MDRIAGFWVKYKGLGETLAVPTIVALVALTAFGLGRLSATGGEGKGLVILMPEGSSQAAAVQESTKTYVASKSGTKYYLPSCSGASRIKEDNKVWFASAAQAQAAGYDPASGCAGL